MKKKKFLIIAIWVCSLPQVVVHEPEEKRVFDKKEFEDNTDDE